jgi:hypothetical protein
MKDNHCFVYNLEATQNGNYNQAISLNHVQVLNL